MCAIPAACPAARADADLSPSERLRRLDGLPRSVVLEMPLLEQGQDTLDALAGPLSQHSTIILGPREWAAFRAPHAIECVTESTSVAPSQELALLTCRHLWVPTMSSGLSEQDFRGMAPRHETGPWPCRFPSLPSSELSSWCARVGATTKTWPSRSSCFATRLPCCAARSSDRLFVFTIGRCSPGWAGC